MEDRRVRRKVNGDFDPKSFYTFHNALRPNTSLSSGIYQDSAGAVNMTDSGSLSSENWQIYYQQGRYFIRNYDYGDYQLGLTESQRSLPRLMKRSGALGQQWSLMRADDGSGWKISNGLLGNGTWLAVAGDNTEPGMSPSDEGVVFDIRINTSAGTPSGSDLFTDVDGFEVAPSSTSSATPSATASATVRSLTSPSSSSATSTAFSVPTLTSTGNDSSSKPLGTGVIAGIAVGACVVALILSLLAWFFVSRRKNKKQQVTAEMPSNEVTAGEKVVYAHMAEIDSSPVVHMAQEKDYREPRYELG